MKSAHQNRAGVRRMRRRMKRRCRFQCFASFAVRRAYREGLVEHEIRSFITHTVLPASTTKQEVTFRNVKPTDAKSHPDVVQEQM